MAVPPSSCGLQIMGAPASKGAHTSPGSTHSSEPWQSCTTPGMVVEQGAG
jgi:hypothetical protein